MSNTEYLVHLVHMNRLTAFFVVYIAGNVIGTRCRDRVKVLWCHFHLLWSVCLGFHPYMHLFSFRKRFCDLFLPFFVLLLRNGKRKERWEGRSRGRCMVYKV